MKLFFLDIDGTIAIPGTDPSPLLRQTIRQLQAQGEKVFLCTGRTYSFTPESVKALGCDGGIFSAGGRILADGQELFRSFMPESIKDSIVALLDTLGGYYVLECDSASYRGGTGLQELLGHPEPGSGMHSELRRLLTVFHHYLPMDQYRGEPVYKIVFLLPSQQAADSIQSLHPAGTNVVFFQNRLAAAHIHLGEISDARINKGVAMHRLCRFYGLSSEDCIAYGDSMNDAEILQAAGEGIAMGNAGENVKCLADRVCGNCVDDGLAMDLRRYLSGNL